MKVVNGAFIVKRKYLIDLAICEFDWTECNRHLQRIIVMLIMALHLSRQTIHHENLLGFRVGWRLAGRSVSVV